MPMKKTGDIECSICEFFVQAIENFITSNASINDIINFANKACSHLGIFANECDHFLDSYLPMLIDALVNRENPDVICTNVIKVCSSSFQQRSRVLSLVSELRKMTEATTTTPQKENNVVADGGSVEASPASCNMCQLIVNAAENYLESGAAANTVESFLDKLCTRLGPAGGLCQDIVALYPDLLDAIFRRETPETVCTQISLCSSN